MTESNRHAASERVESLVDVYRTYRPTVAHRWRLDNAGTRAIWSEQQRRVERLLRRGGFLPLTGRTALDIGCGYGPLLGLLERLGAAPASLHGIDLLSERIEKARELHPGIDLQVGNGEELPYADEAFDLVLLFGVLTSVLDEQMRTNLAAEATRVLRPVGAIVWYDFRYDNPWNPHVRGVRRREVRRLFPGLQAEFETMTLVPPLARRLGPLTRVLYPALTAVPFLRSYNLGLLRKRPSP